ncbi:MAG: FIVAR domain-containing protein [Bifidobacteriaceae bacterium]|jgi:X-Pro dipeptidyl-peptidase|nr:FIVAR domain-containing protein [Bifidobacteriaceae bacterium]
MVRQSPHRAAAWLAAAPTILALSLATLTSLPAAATPLVPTFDPDTGVSQNVFTDRSNWRLEQAWVEIPGVDTDNDGLNDLIHVDVTRQGETYTNGLTVPVILAVSPYFGGGTNAVNHNVYTEVGVDPDYASEPAYSMSGTPATRNVRTSGSGANAFQYAISTSNIATWVTRGFAVAHAELIGSGWSTGCPTVGDGAEQAAVKAAVEWLAGKHGQAYTDIDRATAVPLPSWSTGKVAVMGTSYVGTTPIMAAAAHAEGLAAIIPDSAISEWYNYYRANGTYRYPGAYPGEDLDVLGRYDYSTIKTTHLADPGVCERTVFQDMLVKQDRASGDYTQYWSERDYLKTVPQWDNIGVLIVAGFRDWNVMARNSVNLIEALKANGKTYQVWFHQRGHGAQMPDDAKLNAFLTHWLYGGAPQGGEKKVWVINSKYLEASSISWTNVLPEELPDWPPASTADVSFNLAANTGSAEGGSLSLTPNSDIGTTQTFVDQTYPQVSGWDYGNAVSSDAPFAAYPAVANANGRTVEGHRLIYLSQPLTGEVHLAGTPKVSLRLAVNNRPKANLSVLLVAYPAPGTAINGNPVSTTPQIVSRGWADPSNQTSWAYEDTITPGRFFNISFEMEPKDYIFTTGSRLAFVVLSTDPGFLIRPADGTSLSLNPAFSHLTLPLVGGQTAWRDNTPGSLELLASAINLYALFETNQAAYTAASFAPLAQALADARALLDAGAASQAQIDQAIVALRSAADNLQAAADKSALGSLIDIAQGILDNPSSWVPTKLAELQTALSAARLVFDDADASQSTVDQALSTLSGALAGVLPLADKSLLAALVTLTEGLTATQYTPVTWTVVATALASAQAVLADQNADAYAAEDAADALEAALTALALRAPRAGLESAIQIAGAILSHQADYYPSSLVGLAEAYSAAQTAQANLNATVAEISAAQTALVQAIAKAKLRPTSPAPLPAATTSAANTVTALPAAALTKAKVSLSGKARVGQTVKAKVVGKLAPGSKASWQWYRAGKAIAGATKAAHKVAKADRGKRLTVRLTVRQTGQNVTRLAKQTARVR